MVTDEGVAVGIWPQAYSVLWVFPCPVSVAAMRHLEFRQSATSGSVGSFRDVSSIVENVQVAD